MIILGTSPKEIKKAAAILKNGGLVAFPTETVYGLGADVFNTNALETIFEVKGRPRFDPLIIHIADLDTLEQVVFLDKLDSRHREQLYHLADSLWPGPLTLVLPKQREVPDLATASLPTAAIRFPSHPVARSLIAYSGAVAAPSANRFGCLSPTRAEHVSEMLGHVIDCLIDGSPCTVGVESTVLELVPLPRILRPGGISREQLEAVIGPVLESSKPGTEQLAAPSPGMLQTHYAPGIPLFLYTTEEITILPYYQNQGYLFFSGKSRDQWLSQTNVGQLSDICLTEHIFTLSETAVVTEAAANLFQFLHLLDKSGVTSINAETVPAEGVGAAINDRLQRAAFKL